MPAFVASPFRETVEFVVREVAAVCAGAVSDVTAVHDVGGGGLGVALAEMASSTGVGATVPELAAPGELFSEFPGRFVVATSDAPALCARATGAGVSSAVIGAVGGTGLRIGDLVDLSVDDVQRRCGTALQVALDLAG